MAKRKKQVKLETLLERARNLAAQKGAVIYDIAFRNAGVGILWHESKLEASPPSWRAEHKGRDAWKNGLVVYRYYRTLRQALVAEIKRLQAGSES